MIYGYARVSTAVQANDGNSLDGQVEKLKAAGAEEIYSEHFTGTTMDRPKFNEVVSKLQPGDTFCVCKLDRFARTVSEGGKLIRELLDKGIKVHILNLGILDNSSVGKVLTNILLAFAEFERDMIIERCAEGRRIARTKNGYREGRKPIPENKINNALHMLDSMSYREVAEITGISISSLVKHRRKQREEKAAGYSCS